MTKQRELLLKIEEMTCSACVRHINEALSRVPGVATVEVRLAEKEALVSYDEGSTSPKTLLQALADAGYEEARVAS